MISSEVDPFARSGGLGDAVGGLARALARQGADVVVVTPLYAVTRIARAAAWWTDTVVARVGWGAHDVRTLGVLEVREDAGSPAGSIRFCFLAHDGLFGNRGLYDDPSGGAYWDNGERFVTMSRGALAVAERAWGPGGPDVIHAHDWHAAPAILSSKMTMGEWWASKAALLTIHNLAFQGVLGFDALDRLQIPRGAFFDGTVYHEGNVNLLKGAILLADRVTTVSPTYAHEIRTRQEGWGLEGLLRAVNYKLFGILNGIDLDRFDPENDAALRSTFSAADPGPGRAACKDALVDELGLDGGYGPLFGVVTRLTEQKGMDLLLDVLPALVSRGARFAIVGSGDPRLEDGIRWSCERFPRRVGARIAFDPPLARRVYAGSDFFIMPSRYEPCGLTQMYAMRYGALPVVTAVGGLRDTVPPLDAAHDRGTGFVAATPSPTDLLVACEDALTLYGDWRSMSAAVGRAMRQNHSWQGPASTYLDLYGTMLP